MNRLSIGGGLKSSPNAEVSLHVLYPQLLFIAAFLVLLTLGRKNPIFRKMNSTDSPLVLSDCNKKDEVSSKCVKCVSPQS